MKKTKIICTLGPSSANEKTLTELIEAGMNVARVNFSHGDPEGRKQIFDLVKAVRSKLNVPLAIMLDTKGPEYRIGTFENGSIVLNDGDDFCFTAEKITGNNERVSVSYERLPQELVKGDMVLVNDGLVKLEVTEINGKDIHCRVVTGGKLSDRKSMSFPGKLLKQKYLSENDKEDLLFGIQNGADYAACSFVSTKQDIADVRDFLDANGGAAIKLIAKIENQSGVDHAEEILEHSEGLMVARGDMGVELPVEVLPEVQRRLIRMCRKRGGISIVATEMLESMIERPRPTRAEISDVANSVYEGASAVMLSGETAAGKYPVEAVKVMAAIAGNAEDDMAYDRIFGNYSFKFKDISDSISHGACQMAVDTGAKCIVACTKSGTTARLVSRFRCSVPILGVTSSEKAFHQLALAWNTMPVLVDEFRDIDKIVSIAVLAAKTSAMAQDGDIVVVTCGTPGKEGSTRLIYSDYI